MLEGNLASSFQFWLIPSSYEEQRLQKQNNVCLLQWVVLLRLCVRARARVYFAFVFLC